MTRWLWRVIAALLAIGVLWAPGVFVLPLVFVGAVVAIAVIVVALALDSEASRDARRRASYSERGAWR